MLLAAHHAVEPIRTLLLVYRHDVVNRVMMLLQSLRCRVMVRGCGGGHNAVNVRVMLNFITVAR